MAEGTQKPTTRKLLCPPLSKIVHYLTWDDQKLDLGSIAAMFGLDPSTLKLNGHFISRGVDLVSPSVTWRSLVSFFSSKGLSTGKDDKDALIVDGRLCRAGTKRGHDPTHAASWNQHATERDSVGDSRGQLQQEEDVNWTNKKLKESYSGREVSKWNGFKRKQLIADVNSLKKLKIQDASSDSGGSGNNYPRIVSGGLFKCAHKSGNAKRMREDEAILAAPCKRRADESSMSYYAARKHLLCFFPGKNKRSPL